MKKRLFMFAVLLLSGLQFAVAAIDEQLRALITTSDDIEVTEVTNDEAYPWTVADGMASSTNGKQQYTTSTITIKFKTIGRTTLNFDYTLDGYSNYDSLKVAVDGKLWWASYESKKVLSPRIEFMDIKEGEHVLTFSHRHGYYTYSSATEVISLGNIRIRSLESQNTRLSWKMTMTTRNKLKIVVYLQKPSPASTSNRASMNELIKLSSDSTSSIHTRVPTMWTS